MRTYMISTMNLTMAAKKYYAVDLYRNIPDAPFRAQSRIDADNPGIDR